MELRRIYFGLTATSESVDAELEAIFQNENQGLLQEEHDYARWFRMR